MKTIYKAQTICYFLLTAFIIGCASQKNPEDGSTSEAFSLFLRDCSKRNEGKPLRMLKKPAQVTLPALGTYQRSYQAHVAYVWEEFCKAQLDSEVNCQIAYTDSSRNYYRKLIVIGDLFNTGQTSALVGYSTSDSTIKIHGFKKMGKQFEPFFETVTKNPKTGGDPQHHLIDFFDFNGDQIKDLKIRTNIAWMTDRATQAQLWIYKDEQLVPVPEFEKVVNAEFDTDDGKVYSYRSAGCGDMNMQFETYKWKQNQLVLEQTIFCDCCSRDTCNIYINQAKVPITKQINETYTVMPKHWQVALKHKLRK